MTAESLVEALVDRQRQRAKGHELNWARTIKTSKGEYLTAVGEAIKELEEGRRSCADFLAAFACELEVDDGDQLEPTPFYMTSGQQRFLNMARTLAGRLAEGIKRGRRKKEPEELFSEALYGPWRYEDSQHSMGWDPSTERLHALRATKPGDDESDGIPAAVWLAFEALPLFPCFRCEGRLVTTGFRTTGVTRRERTTYLTWPVWSSFISLDALRSLLSLPELAEDVLPVHELRARGIEQVFRSERFRVKTQGAYYILRAAEPCM
jgi:hypothetical protein